MPAQANRGEAREAGAAQAGADLPALLHDWAIVLALVVAVLGAGYLRGALLWPQSAGLREPLPLRRAAAMGAPGEGGRDEPMTRDEPELLRQASDR